MKKKSGFVKINFIIGSSANRHLVQALERKRVLDAWGEAIVEFFEGAGMLTKAVDFKAGRLTIACLSKELAYQIRILSQRIMYAINQLIGRNLVFSINLEV